MCMNAAKPCGPGPPNIPNKMAQPWKIKGSAHATRMMRSSRFSSRAVPVNRLNVLMDTSRWLDNECVSKDARERQGGSAGDGWANGDRAGPFQGKQARPLQVGELGAVG